LEEFDSITVESALKHPKWSMGAKISIDSATMMNKALEVIEAHWLFDLPPEGIEVVVHPEHIIHSLIRLQDGSVLAQLSVPDMKGPIGFGLIYPDGRLRGAMPHLDLYQVAQMNFERVNDDKFPGVSRARECLRLGGGASAVLNSANEVAVEAFIQRQIPFTGINRLIGDALHHFGGIGYSGLEDLVALCSSVSDWARQRVGIVPK
jgi:1-deoxy-D-xylulose-5-phosphate reductoisomerase